MLSDHEANYRAVLARDPRFDGRLFVGVKTTGVYCRPVCPARTPMSRNVLFYPTAAAAQEAGFRPCLRCRPETAPDLGAWRGTSNTVERALRLIEMGALDDGDVEALAGRLGVGERHLRRLFKQHVGAAPVSVAQTRRVLLAKQLLQETRLPMGEVALAAGFGSIRRFNETFAALYDRPPAALRRLGGAAPAGEALTVRLPYKPPYDFGFMLDWFAHRAVPGVERVERGAYSRTIVLDGEAGAITVAKAKGDALCLTVRFPTVSALPLIIARVRRMWDLSADPEALARDLSKDAMLAPLVAARPGLRIPGCWDGFEQAMRTVLGQQITIVAATRLTSRLVDRAGSSLAAPIDSLTRVFPSPAQAAAADFTAFGMPGARIKALVGLARAAEADPALFTPGADLSASVKKLTALAGVGEWTAHYIAMRTLREPDAFPAADVGLWNAVAKTGRTRPNAREMIAMADAWRPWRAYATQHLWASLTVP